MIDSRPVYVAKFTEGEMMMVSVVHDERPLSLGFSPLPPATRKQSRDQATAVMGIGHRTRHTIAEAR